MNAKLSAVLLLAALCASHGHAAWAQSALGADEGKLLLTAGFSDVEGAGGGGLVPWALITGYGSSDSWGANAHVTDIQLRDFQLHGYGLAVGLFDRLELSYARHQFEVTGTALDGLEVSQSIYGLKVKLFGDAIYGQDNWLPQVAAGAEYKRNGGFDDSASAGLPGLVSPTQLGAKSNNGTDYYLAATKVLLAQSLLLNATVRYTKANELGLLGFGGDRDSGYSARGEATIGYLIVRNLAGGAEFRMRPHNLSIDDESNAWDIFLAWAPTKNISVVAAYLDMGSILGPATGVTRQQNGPYLSLQAGF